jgi:DNA repair protein RadA/Sms
MQAKGLLEVENPSHLFCSTKEAGHAGTIATAVIEGSRALVVEIQSLVSPTHFGMPQRVCAGINQKKLALLLAVMEKHAGVNLGEHDVFINVAGGLRVDDTASDIAVCAAVLSSFFDKIPAQPTACIGEVGLSGEIRSPHRSDMRVKEIDTMGIARCCLPALRLSYTPVRTSLVGCAHIAELAQVLF